MPELPWKGQEIFYQANLRASLLWLNQISYLPQAWMVKLICFILNQSAYSANIPLDISKCSITMTHITCYDFLLAAYLNLEAILRTSYKGNSWYPIKYFSSKFDKLHKCATKSWSCSQVNMKAKPTHCIQKVQRLVNIKGRW